MSETGTVHVQDMRSILTAIQHTPKISECTCVNTQSWECAVVSQNLKIRYAISILRCTPGILRSLYTKITT